MPIYRFALTSVMLLFFSPLQSQAATTFTDRSSFLSALPDPAGVLNFESLPGGANLSGATQAVSGGPGVGINFPASVTDWQGNSQQMQVVENVDDSNPTTSNPNSLGTDSAGNFNTIVGGTSFTLGLTAPVSAFGLYFITPDSMYDGDIVLAAGNGSASLAAAVRTLIGNFGGSDYYAYFLGVIDNDGFSSASILYGPDVTGGPFLYNIDDITVATVPLPGSLVLMMSGISVLIYLWRGGRSDPRHRW